MSASAAGSTDPVEVVMAFCRAWPALDVDALVSYFTDDATYHNIPMQPVVGREQIAATIAGFTTGVQTVTFEVLAIAAADRVVLTERVDSFTWPGGHTAALPVMGTFEVTPDGLISAWRDYFDMNQFMSQLPQG